jgi:hypothetical protein
MLNTYTNVAGDLVTERMTPEYPTLTDPDDSKQWPEDQQSSEILPSSRGVTLEAEGDRSFVPSSIEGSPEFEGGHVSWRSSREVSPGPGKGRLSPTFSRTVSPGLESGRLSPPFSRAASPEPVTYYTPQAADPDFDYIPLREKRRVVSEHDRKQSKAESWKMITSLEELDLNPGKYVKYAVKDGTVIYRKPSYQMGLGNEVGTIGSQTSVNIDGFRVCRNPVEGGLPPGCEVRLVFEVSPHNSPHPESWLGLPTTYLFEDAWRAETLALRIEWKGEKGETRCEYLRYTHSPLLFSTAHEGQYDGLGLAIGILNHLENREIVQNQRRFVRDFGTARMLNVSVDFFRQEINLQDVLDPPQKIADAGIRKPSTIHRELTAAGAENIDLQFGTFCGTEDRTRCDRCLVAHTIATGTAGSDRIATMCSVVDCDGDCKLALGTNRCTHCQQLGIDCTYTNDVLEKPALLRALWLAPRPLAGAEIFSIVDPKLVTTVDR